MSEKLKEHLAKLGAEALQPLLGAQVVDLLMHIGQEAMAPEAMVELMITSRGPSNLLLDEDVRSKLVNGLDNDESRDLCRLLKLGAAMPRSTLAGHNFNQTNSTRILFEWFGVPREMGDDTDDFSRNVTSPEKLKVFQEPAYRQLRGILNDPAAKVLVHMPFGAGKLRTVATAVLEAFRSEPDGKSIFWLAPDGCLCDDAMQELEAVWRHLGLRDVTTFRLYGGRRQLPIDPVSNAIVVADANELHEAMSATDVTSETLQTLRDFGGCIRHIVLSDAEQAQLPGIRSILEKLSEGGQWTLVGISASPGPIASNATDTNLLRRMFGDNVIEIEHEDPMDALRQAGEVDPIEIHTIVSPISSLDTHEDWISLPREIAESLSLDVERNKVILDELHRLAQAGERIVFHAATAQQARTIAGLLGLKGTAASTVTADVDANRRSIEIGRFNSDESYRVLCAHGVLVSSEQVSGITACVLGLPTTSAAVIHEMVGRLATGRKTPSTPLQVYAVADPVPAFLRLVERLDTWDKLKL